MRIPHLTAVTLACVACGPSFAAEDSPWSLSLRAGMSAASGVPSNDSINLALAVRYRLSPGRHLGFEVEQMEFDYERPWRIVDRPQDTTAEPEDIDSDASSLLLSAFYERLHGGPDASWIPYWAASLAVASPDTPPVTGPVQGGGTFDVHTDAGTEIIPGLRGGLLWKLGTHWSADFSLTVNHHIADWEVVDRQTGNTGKVESYTHYGAQVGLLYRF